MVDSISTQTGFALDSKLTASLYNPLAAVPSLHAGFALAVGVAIARHARSRATRILGALWPATVAVAVVATGNHFVVDIAAGALATLAGLAISLVAERLRWRRPGGRPGRGWLRMPRELPAQASA